MDCLDVFGMTLAVLAFLLVWGSVLSWLITSQSWLAAETKSTVSRGALSFLEMLVSFRTCSTVSGPCLARNSTFTTLEAFAAPISFFDLVFWVL